MQITKAAKDSELLMEEFIMQILMHRVRNDFCAKSFTVVLFVIAKD